jgi:hypothetical protein
MKAILVAIALVAVPTATSAGELTGNDLLPACRDFVEKQFHKDPLNQGQCIGII